MGAGNYVLRAGLAFGLTAACHWPRPYRSAAHGRGDCRNSGRAGNCGEPRSERDARGAKMCWSGPHPKLAARISRGVLAALHRRSSVVSLKVDDPVNHVICDYHQDRQYYSASVVKATILAALLRKLMAGAPLPQSRPSRPWPGR